MAKTNEHKCPYCETVMEQKCYISTGTGEVVSTFYECPKCRVKI